MKATRGFTLIELLVTIGILAVLISVTAVSYKSMVASADKTRCQELVHNTALALQAYYLKEGGWPRVLLQGSGESSKMLDADHALVLAPYATGNNNPRGYMSLSIETESRDGETFAKKLKGYDRFGIVSPWATSIIKSKGNEATLSTRVSTGGTIKEHIFRYEVDADGDGIIEGVNVGGESIDVRANVIVWCAGKDGVMQPYSKGLRSDDCYSWGVGQTQKVK